MRRLTLALGLAVAVSGLVMGARPASAVPQFLTYSAGFPTTGLQATNWGTSLTLPQFNSALGALQKVSWTLSGDLGGSAQIWNQVSVPQSVFTYQLRGTVTLKDPGGTQIAQVIPLVDEAPPEFVLGDHEVRNFNDLSAHESTSGFTVDPVKLAQYIGVGTISLPVSARGTALRESDANVASLESLSARADVTLRYDYDDGVPEPATLSLIGLGCLGLVRRQRSKKRA